MSTDKFAFILILQCLIFFLLFYVISLLLDLLGSFLSLLAIGVQYIGHWTIGFTTFHKMSYSHVPLHSEDTPQKSPSVRDCEAILKVWGAKLPVEKNC